MARDCRGRLVFAHPKKVKATLPLQAEAFNWATHLVGSYNFPRAVIEGDSKNCVNALKNPEKLSCWRLEAIMADTAFKASQAPIILFKWAPREANKAAHALAK